MNRKKNSLENISKQIQYCRNTIESLAECQSELFWTCSEIIQEVCASRGVKITSDQADILLTKFGVDAMSDCYRFIREIESFLRCSKGQLQNWVYLGEDAVIKFHF